MSSPVNLKNGNYALLEVLEFAVDADRYRLVEIGGEKCSIKQLEDLRADGLIKIIRVLTPEQFKSLMENVVK